MNEKPQTKSEGLRLHIEHWRMLRALIQGKGRDWLEKLISREFRKLEK